MKRYVLLDRKNLTTHEYSSVQWNLAWVIVFLLGMLNMYLILITL